MNHRTKSGGRASLIGLFVNLLLAAGKMVVGLLIGAMSIFADGVNNLFDAASSAVSLAAFVLAGRPSDEKHPFGHARYEYLGSFLIGLVILYVAFTLIVQGVKRTLQPTPLALSPLAIVILIISIVCKIGLSVFYDREAERIHSNVLHATAADARSDIFATGAILLALLVAPIFHLTLDGPFTILVALVIGKNGIGILSENIDALLGQRPDEAFVCAIDKAIRTYPGVLGMHDLTVHDYGPGRRFVTVHVELDGQIRTYANHALVDKIEKEVGQSFDVDLTIHMDPVENEKADPRDQEDRGIAPQRKEN